MTVIFAYKSTTFLLPVSLSMDNFSKGLLTYLCQVCCQYRPRCLSYCVKASKLVDYKWPIFKACQ